jgi:hypothetical protein
MARKRKEAAVSETKFKTEPSFFLDGFEINAGDTIKIKNEYGSKFKVRGLTTNIETGAQWVDCFEMIRGIPSAFRAFKLDRVKRVPKRGKRARRVNNGE